MLTEVFMPKMTDHMESGVIVEWLVEVGDTVEQGQPLVEIETDKTDAELEAPASGVLLDVRPDASETGTEIRVGDTFAFISDDPAAASPGFAAVPAEGAAPDSRGEGDPAKDTPRAESTETAGTTHGDAIRATPAARRVAKELGIDLQDIGANETGTRLSEDDVRNAARLSDSDRSLEAATRPLSRVQKASGRVMVESIQTVPQFTLRRAVGADALEQARRDVGDPESKASVTAVLVVAVALALAESDRFHVSYRDGELVQHRDPVIGVAVATPDGLVTPVVHNAHTRGIAEVDATIRELAAAAREGSLQAEQTVGATFTISNLGMFEVDSFRAIVVPPQVAILAVGRVMPAPLVASGSEQPAASSVINLSLSVDHRAADGVDAAQFFQVLCRHIEEFGRD